MVLIFSPWRVTVDNNQEISEGIREKKESITNLWLHCTFSQSFPGFISRRFRFKAESTIWKLSFASTVRPIVHTNPSQKLNFWKTLFKLEGLYNGSFFFRADKKHFENRCVFKRWHHDYHVISPMKLFFWNADQTCARRSVNGKHLMRFQGKTSNVKFLHRSVVALDAFTPRLCFK